MLRSLWWAKGPGEDEAYNGVPFIGRSGRMLDSWIARAGLYRHRLWIDNVVRCWMNAGRDTTGNPTGNRAPHVAEINHCRTAHWEASLAALSNLRVVVAIGVPAMRALVDRKANADWAGRVSKIEIGGREVFAICTLHPAYVMRGQWGDEPFQVLCLKRAKVIAERGSWPIDDPYKPPPGAIPEPTLAQLREWTERTISKGEVVAVDIETAGRTIIMVGVCRASDLIATCFHFLCTGGSAYWAPDDEDEMKAMLWELLASPCPKVFHNGQAFDVPILEANGFEVGNYLYDTLLMQHIAYAEMKAGLEHCARLYCGVNGWKTTLKGDVDGEWK